MRVRSARALANEFAPLLLLLAVPLLQLASSPSWMFNSAEIDDWVYHGYFVHLRNHIVEFSGTYYGTRLAWIFPGALAHYWLAPLAANFALRLFLYSTTLLSAFFMVRRSYGVRCAVLCCLLLAGDARFLGEIGWDYVDGAGLAYLMVALEELSAASQALAQQRARAAWVRGCLAGFFYACAVHTNTLLLSFIPILAVGFFVRSGINRPAVMLIRAMVAGSALSTAMLGIISRILGGPILFFMPSLTFMFSIGRHANPWREPVLQWLPTAAWLIIPFTVTVVSILCMILWWRSKKDQGDSEYWRSRYSHTGMIVAAWGMFTFLQFGTYSPMFQFFFVTSYLIPFTLAAAGALMGRNLNGLPAPAFGLLALLSAGLALAIGTQSLHRLPSPVARLVDTPEPLLYCLIALVLACAAAVVLKPRWAGGALAGIGVSWWLLHASVVAGYRDRNHARAEYVAVNRATHDLETFMGPRRLFFWFQPNQTGDMFVPIMSTFLYNYSIIGFKMPDATGINFDPAARIVILASREKAISEARAALVQAGNQLSQVAELREPAPDSSFEIGIFDVIRRKIPDWTLVGKPIHDQDVRPVWLKQWVKDELIGDCKLNFYGPKHASLVRPRLFRSQDSRDHVAPPFVELPKDATIAGVRIEADSPDFDTAYGPGRVYLQDQSFRTLYDSGSAFEKSLRVTVPVPPDVSSVRVIFIPNDDKYISVANSLSIGVVTNP